MNVSATTTAERPNRLDNNYDEKEYHLKWGQYVVGAGWNNASHQLWLQNIIRNENFYTGNQWLDREDVEVFLKDETNQERTRIKVVNNIIRPMVEQYRGNAIRLSIDATAKSTSPMAINRREEKLKELLFIQNQAQLMPEFSEAISQRAPIGKTKQETEQIFRNLYVDDYQENINLLLDYVANLNQFKEFVQINLAEQVALSGIGVVYDFEASGHHRFESILSKRFYWDRASRRPDLKDAEYMGFVEYLSAPQIFEQGTDLNEEQMKAIEAFQQFANDSQTMYANSAGSTYGVNTGSVEVHNTFWRDTLKLKFGYVLDEFGYPMFTKIGYVEDGDTEPKYTEKDLIDPPNTARAKRIMKGKKVINHYSEVIKYCRFVPNVGNVKDKNSQRISDVILEYGMLPYMETDFENYCDVRFPFKVYAWSYINGEVKSPIDDAIDPQRLVNRVLSVAENQMNNSRGAGYFIDRSAIDGVTTEEEMITAQNQSKPIVIDAKLRGVQNVVFPYDTTIRQGTMVMFNIVDTIRGMVQQSTGVNDALQGEAQGQDQLVGVTQMLIQRGSLMQEPFYNCIRNIMVQCYQAVASRGKRIYIDNERELVVITGDEGAKSITMSKDIRNEDFRIFVKLDSPEETLINAGNQMLLTLRSMGLIDDIKVANLFNRSTPDQVARALRDSAVNKLELARVESEQQNQQNQQMMQQMQMMQQEQNAKEQMYMAREDNAEELKHQRKLEQIFARSQASALAKQGQIPQQQSQ
jgi:hypothetical protein